MSTTISIFCKGNITHIPPVYNAALALVENGYVVKLYVGEIEDDTNEFLLNNGRDRLEIINFSIDGLSKISKWMRFRKYAIKNLDYNTVVWYASLDTAIVMYGNHLRRNKFIISVLELYDNANPYTRFFLKRILPLANKIVVPEFNRAAILRTWYKLKEMPIILPNKPFIIELPTEYNYIIQLKKKILGFANGRKILIYQGLITSERNIDVIVKAVKHLQDDFCMILMGLDFGYADSLVSLGEGQILYIGNVNSPHHLHLTHLAHIGIVSYDFIDLNNIFCAPNKIWEYAAFGKPMLANNIPGLKYTVEQNMAGICTDINNLESVSESLQTLLDNYEEYSANAGKFFLSVEIQKITKQIIEG